MLHLRFEGRSYDIAAEKIPTGRNISDQQIFERLARHLDVDPKRFQHYVIDRRPNGTIVRPEAVYG